MSRSVFRFAPSPNGQLHLGHAYSALLNHDMARACGGQFLVRIEDIDVTRSRESHIAGILEDLAWLGLTFDPPRRQSAHFDDYAVALGTLERAGLLYPSSASRGDIARAVAALEETAPWPRDPDGAPHYPRAALETVPCDPGEPVALRLDMARASHGLALTFVETGSGRDGEAREVAADPQVWGDAIIRRKEFPASYALAVVVDDALQGVTHVVRGMDLFHATSLQRLLQHHLGLPAPVYHHHRLILGAAGEKLSKSLGSTSLASLRANGAEPDDIRRWVGLDRSS